MFAKILRTACRAADRMGAILGLVHLVVSWWILIYVGTSERDAQWQLIWIFLLPFDFPFSLLVLFSGSTFPEFSFNHLPSPLNDFHGFIIPTIIYGFVGPLWYLFLPILVDGVMTIRSRRPFPTGSV